MKELLLVIILCQAINISAQVKTDKRSIYKKATNQETKTVPVPKAIPFITELESRLPSADRYVIDVKSLLSYFTNPSIPKNFPLYDPSKNFKRNKKMAIKYLKRHTELLREEVKVKLHTTNTK